MGAIGEGHEGKEGPVIVGGGVGVFWHPEPGFYLRASCNMVSRMLLSRNLV